MFDTPFWICCIILSKETLASVRVMNHVHSVTFLHRYIVSVVNKFRKTSYLSIINSEKLTCFEIVGSRYPPKPYCSLQKSTSIRDCRRTGSYTVRLALINVHDLILLFKYSLNLVVKSGINKTSILFSNKP
jgi:hypothetical protein